MRKRSVATVVAGGLISGAAAIGVDGSLHDAGAATLVQSADLQLSKIGTDPWVNAITYCGVCGPLVFDGFDSTLGVLNTATLEVSIAGLTNAPALTCCYDINDIEKVEGTIAGTPMADLVAGLGDGSVRLFLDPKSIGPGSNTVAFDLGIFFKDRTVYPDANIQLGGTARLSYDYTPASVPLPSSAAFLGTVSLFAMMAGSVAARRRRRSG